LARNLAYFPCLTYFVDTLLGTLDEVGPVVIQTFAAAVVVVLDEIQDDHMDAEEVVKS
jgi:hypothetical protein